MSLIILNTFLNINEKKYNVKNNGFQISEAIQTIDKRNAADCTLRFLCNLKGQVHFNSISTRGGQAGK